MSIPVAEASYDRLGRTYAARRVTDARIAAVIDRALGDARSVVNVGAGTGSYEPPIARWSRSSPRR
jgi:hypothetical protein